MEITKMLTISTAHVSNETAELLDIDDILGVVLYPKDDYGWFIHIDEDFMNDYEDEIPKELFKLMKFTKDIGCDWLCLDSDGEVLEYLDVYEW